MGQFLPVQAAFFLTRLIFTNVTISFVSYFLKCHLSFSSFACPISPFLFDTELHKMVLIKSKLRSIYLRQTTTARQWDANWKINDEKMRAKQEYAKRDLNKTRHEEKPHTPLNMIYSVHFFRNGKIKTESVGGKRISWLASESILYVHMIRTKCVRSQGENIVRCNEFYQEIQTLKRNVHCNSEISESEYVQRTAISSAVNRTNKPTKAKRRIYFNEKSRNIVYSVETLKFNYMYRV